MRKWEALPGTRIELLLDLIHPKIGWAPQRALSQHQVPEKRTAPLPGVLPGSKLDNLLPCSFPRMSCLQAQAARFSAGPPLVCSLPSVLGKGWAAWAHGEAQTLLENSTLAEGSVDPAQPCPGWEFRRAGLLGSQDGNKNSGWSARLNPVLNHKLSPVWLCQAAQGASHNLKLEKNVTMRSQVLGRALREAEVIWVWRKNSCGPKGCGGLEPGKPWKSLLNGCKALLAAECSIRMSGPQEDGPYGGETKDSSMCQEKVQKASVWDELNMWEMRIIIRGSFLFVF